MTVTRRANRALRARMRRWLGVADPFVGPRSPLETVRAVQALVNRATAQRIAEDGIFGPETHEAVRFLQRRVELPLTGVVDPVTLLRAHERVTDALEREGARRRFLLELPRSSRPARQHLIMDAPQKLFVPRELQAHGLAGAEPESFAPFLASLDGRTSGTFLDVGANVGTFSLLAAALSDWEVFAFEPTPELAATAGHIAHLNGLAVRVEETALGREDGVATFFLSNVTDASNSLAAGFRKTHHSVDVRVETLDHWCARMQVVPHLIKIDTESTEPDVLAGGRETLAKARPTLLCEVLPGRRTQELQTELEPLGYTWYHLRAGKPLQPTTALTPSDEGHNWLFTPEPLDASFLARTQTWAEALAALEPRESR